MFPIHLKTKISTTLYISENTHKLIRLNIANTNYYVSITNQLWFGDCCHTQTSSVFRVDEILKGSNPGRAVVVSSFSQFLNFMVNMLVQYYENYLCDRGDVGAMNQNSYFRQWNYHFKC